MKYRKKSSIIEAVRYDKANPDEALKFVPSVAAFSAPDGTLCILSFRGSMECSDGDYIIRDIKGKYYPCKPDIFAQTYEPIN
ncbi:MAG: hypothetical protein LBK41_03175 [Clostridiales bacterium]|nr:hypothetical protein [Clostridiales bacterium]